MPKLKNGAKLFLASVLMWLSAFSASAQLSVIRPDKGSPMGAEFLRWNVTAMCDPMFGSRATADSGSVFISTWIRRNFERAGLQPYGGSWFHSFDLPGGGRGHNVVGCIPGKSGKWIVVGAYYDGIGKVGDAFYPGADSNASGVAALISLAFSVTREPKDGIIFVAFDGHACDYAGARKMLKEVGKKKIRLMVSLDTIGSTMSPVERKYRRYMMALGGEKYSKTLGKCAELGGIKLYYDYYRSQKFTELFYRKIGDQKVFLQAKVPSVVFTSGITMNTNKTADTPETLDYEVLRARVLCISRWLSIISSSR